MSCGDVQRELSRFIDGEVALALRVEMREHFLACDPCRDDLVALRRLSHRARERSVEQASRSVTELRSRLRRSVSTTPSKRTEENIGGAAAFWWIQHRPSRRATVASAVMFVSVVVVVGALRFGVNGPRRAGGVDESPPSRMSVWSQEEESRFLNGARALLGDLVQLDELVPKLRVPAVPREEIRLDRERRTRRLWNDRASVDPRVRDVIERIDAFGSADPSVTSALPRGDSLPKEIAPQAELLSAMPAEPVARMVEVVAPGLTPQARDSLTSLLNLRQSWVDGDRDVARELARQFADCRAEVGLSRVESREEPFHFMMEAVLDEILDDAVADSVAATPSNTTGADDVTQTVERRAIRGGYEVRVVEESSAGSRRVTIHRTSSSSSSGSWGSSDPPPDRRPD